MEEIVMFLPGILLAYGAFALGMFSPGPNILSVIGTSMGVSRKSGKALALGIASGSFLWGLLTLFGLTALLTLYASALTAIKFAGAAYLLWLAFKAFRSAARNEQMIVSQVADETSPLLYFRRGLLIQMTNPKAALTWVAIMSLGVEANAPVWVGASIVLGTTVLSVGGHLAYAVLFSTSPMVAAYRAARRWIEVALGTFFCFASYKLLTADTK
ncbi:MAG: LysE family translocator [Hyphomicrobiaceae bacterium]|nr:LysE family translocator [Hyphomicrobiaceae bacterium]